MQYEGVPIAGIKTIQSMNHIPFSNKNFDNGFWFINNNQSMSGNTIENALEQRQSGTYFYGWDMLDKHFHRIKRYSKPFF